MIVGDRIQLVTGNCFSKKNQERHYNITKYNDKKDVTIQQHSNYVHFGVYAYLAFSNSIRMHQRPGKRGTRLRDERI